ncbi:MAG: hypothetical protein M3Q58_04040, partial [Bacteroidota bacterium]|nr:hypothetical protein [Bacteroidota bacterium]
MIIRPDVKDENILLSVAGAFTRLDDDKVDGLFINGGKLGNFDRINKTLGGGILFVHGKAKIFPTEK